MSPHLANFENGADFRARIEVTFDRAKRMISSAGLEILVPSAGEFFLGPALAIQQSGNRTPFNVAIGDSTAIVLPFGVLVGSSSSWADQEPAESPLTSAAWRSRVMGSAAMPRSIAVRDP